MKKTGVEILAAVVGLFLAIGYKRKRSKILLKVGVWRAISALKKNLRALRISSIRFLKGVY